MVDWGEEEEQLGVFIGVIYKAESFAFVYLLLPLAKCGASLLNFKKLRVESESLNIFAPSLVILTKLCLGLNRL